MKKIAVNSVQLSSKNDKRYAILIFCALEGARSRIYFKSLNEKLFDHILLEIPSINFLFYFKNIFNVNCLRNANKVLLLFSKNFISINL